MQWLILYLIKYNKLYLLFEFLTFEPYKFGGLGVPPVLEGFKVRNQFNIVTLRVIYILARTDFGRPKSHNCNLQALTKSELVRIS